MDQTPNELWTPALEENLQFLADITRDGEESVDRRIAAAHAYAANLDVLRQIRPLDPYVGRQSPPA